MLEMETAWEHRNFTSLYNFLFYELVWYELRILRNWFLEIIIIIFIFIMKRKSDNDSANHVFFTICYRLLCAYDAD